MKKTLIFFLANFALINLTYALVFVLVDCEQYATDMMEVVENHFGCLDTDVYNDGWEHAYDTCMSSP